MRTATIILFLCIAGVSYMTPEDMGFVILAAMAAVVAIGEILSPRTSQEWRANSRWWNGK